MLSLDNIEVDPANVRSHYDDEMLEGLRQILRNEGEYINPPHVYPVSGGRFRVKHGNTRVMAARGVVAELPVLVVEPPVSDEQKTLAQLSENLVQGGLTPLDTAHALKKLKDSGLSLAGIVDHLKEHGVVRGRTWVHDHLKLLEQPPAVQEAVQSGATTFRDAIYHTPTPNASVTQPSEATLQDVRDSVLDAAIRLNEEQARPKLPPRTVNPDHRASGVTKKWELFTVEGDDEALVDRAAAENGWPELVIAVNALRAVLERGSLPDGSALAELLRQRARRLLS